MSKHPIPGWLRSQFSRIEDEVQKLGPCGVFTQMRTVTQTYFEQQAEAAQPPACCTPTAEENALLAAGDYRPEELWGVGGKPSCPKCYAAPQPPALGGELNEEISGLISIMRNAVRDDANNGGREYHQKAKVAEENLRSHLAPLKAELDRQRAVEECYEHGLKAYEGANAGLRAELVALKAQRDELEAGLRIIATAGTKTRAPDLRMTAKQTLNRALSKPDGSEKV
ncbi:hypothetical protein [Pseudomonas syringae]|uniref:hypothetical protein n=1 Tax=Pseudomonas syringae TaxID=317 RepID=UPI000EFF8BB2|nr:hypothetical protein [Pseudomonas syringae]